MGTVASSYAKVVKGEAPEPWDALPPELWALLFTRAWPREFVGLRGASHWTRWLFWHYRTEYTPATLAHLELYARRCNRESVASVDLALLDDVPDYAFALLSTLPCIQRLRVHEATDRVMESIGQLRCLRELVIEKDHHKTLTEDGITHLTNLSKLEALSMSDCRGYPNEAINLVVSRLPRLRALHCGGGGSGHLIGLDRGRGVQVHRQDLEPLCKALGDGNLSHVGALSHLEELDLGPFGVPTPQGIKRLAALPKLGKLTIRQGQLLDNASVDAIAALPLVDLLLHKVQFVASFQALARCTMLKTLDLKGSFVFNEDLPALATLPRLERLDISRCPKLTDVGMRRFYEVATPTKLTWLKHADCRRLREFNRPHWFHKEGVTWTWQDK
jgi:hypothetical protein